MDVQVGQVWRDNDKRENGLRTVTVERVDGSFAYVVSSPKGRRSRIRINRFRGGINGYTLVEGQ